MRARFTYSRTGQPTVDRAFDQVGAAFARVDQPELLTVVKVSKLEYRAVGNEDLIVANRSCTIVLPAPSGPWHATIVQGGKAVSVKVTCVSSSVPIDGNAPGSVALDAAYSSASVFTDGTEYYVVGGTAAAPVIPPIPPFPPVVPPVTPPTPVPVTAPWFAPVNFGGALVQDATGTETWQGEELVDFTGSPTSLTLYWWFQALSTSGTGTLRIRVGGSAYRALDGVILSAWPETSASMIGRSLQTSIAPLTGIKRVTLSAQSSGAGQKVQIQGMNAQFR